MKKLKFMRDGQMYEYEIYQLVDRYDPILKEALPPFDFVNPPVDPKYLAISLIQTMIEGKGLGLAANQVGLQHRVFVMGVGDYGQAFFNPSFVSLGDDVELETEGCLSYPGLFLDINRFRKIDVTYRDMNGIEQHQIFEGLTARIFQHELDHLNGITFTKRVSSMKLTQAQKKVKTNLKKMKQMEKLQLLQAEKIKLERAIQKNQNIVTAAPGNTDNNQKIIINTDNL